MKISGREGKRVEKPRSSTIDAELGRFTLDRYELKQGLQKVFDTAGDILPETGSREAYKTPCFRELTVFFPCDEPFRKSAHKLNRVLWREEEQMVQSRTIANIVEREGEAIQACVETQAKEILKRHSFTAQGVPMGEKKACRLLAQESVLCQESVYKAAKELNDALEKERQIDVEAIQNTCEHPASVLAKLSVDDVLCKKQKESGRKKGSPPKTKQERVKNTVAHIQSGKGNNYTLTTANVTHMMIVVLAFLLNNELLLLPGQVVFFTDGAEDLLVAIKRAFEFFPYKIILDWYHLEKKCQQRLSMAMKGKARRNKVLEELLAWLWVGKVEMAMTYLRGLQIDDLKDADQIEQLIGYFSRNSSCIPCYALRQKLGLRLSSNLVEKANDLVVSSRQKHNGMSWSADGSTSLATLTSVRLNDEHMNWLLHHDITFTFPQPAAKAAA